MSPQARVPTEILCEVFQLLQHPDVPILLAELHNSCRWFSDWEAFPWAVGRSAGAGDTRLYLTHLYGPLLLCTGISTAEEVLPILPKPTDVRPYTSNDLGGYLQRRPSKAIKTLVSCSKRWKRLDICIDYESDMELLRCKGNLPNLTTLMITGDIASNLRVSSIFKATPSLTNLDVSRRIGKIAFPWAQLTRFKILIRWEDYCRYGNELWPALLQLQNVEMLELLGVPNFTPFRATFSKLPVQLPRLLFLETTLGYFELLSWFVAPSLEHLRINDRNDYLDENDTCHIWNGVFSMINRSSCHVRQLTLRQCTFCAAPAMLEAFASVEELVIEYPTETFPILLRYIAGFDDHIYLPMLRVLKMKYCPRHNIEELVATMSQFLEARGKGSRLAPASCAPLEKLVIQLRWCSWCPGNKRRSNDIPWNALEAIQSLQSDADIHIYIDDSDSEIRSHPGPPPWSDLHLPYMG